MTTATSATLESPRAFAVRFKDLHLWSVGSFVRVKWRWPKEYIRPLSTALWRRVEEVDRGWHSIENLQLVTLHFDGTMEPRDRQGQNRFKGRLFFAFAGDVVYSKIDVRNGAIGVVPTEMPRVAVSSEYPVYRVSPDIAVPSFIKLLFRTDHFRRALNSMISGASGRKRVQPEQIEAIEVPFPPLGIQHAIIDRWDSVQKEMAAAREYVKRNEAGILKMILDQLGVPFRAESELPKMFALWWKDLARWGVGYLARMVSGPADIRRAKYPSKMLGEIAQVSYGIAKSPANRPGRQARPYLRVANVQRGELNLSEIKFIDVPDSELNAVRLQRGDLLVCEGNSADLVGRPAIWNDEIPDCVHQNHILRVRVNSTFALPEFILEYMQTPPARNYFRARAKFTTNLASINSTDLRELEVPLPPLSVQREILRSVSEARREILREREKARQLAATVQQEIEEMILGVRLIPVVDGEPAGKT